MTCQIKRFRYTPDLEIMTLAKSITFCNIMITPYPKIITFQTLHHEGVTHELQKPDNMTSDEWFILLTILSAATNQASNHLNI